MIDLEVLNHGENSNIKLKSKSNCERSCRRSIIKTWHTNVYRNRYVFKSNFSTGGIPFAVTLPKVPNSINMDLMTTEELHAKLQRGNDDIEAGKVQSAASAFAKFKENH